MSTCRLRWDIEQVRTSTSDVDYFKLQVLLHPTRLPGVPPPGAPDFEPPLRLRQLQTREQLQVAKIMIIMAPYSTKSSKFTLSWVVLVELQPSLDRFKGAVPHSHTCWCKTTDTHKHSIKGVKQLTPCTAWKQIILWAISSWNWKKYCVRTLPSRRPGDRQHELQLHDTVDGNNISSSRHGRAAVRRRPSQVWTWESVLWLAVLKFFPQPTKLEKYLVHRPTDLRPNDSAMAGCTKSAR